MDLTDSVLQRFDLNINYRSKLYGAHGGAPLAEPSRALLNEMIGRVYFTSGNNFDIIRTRAIELVALLSRALVENGGDQAQVYRMTEEALRKIVGKRDMTGLSYTLLKNSHMSAGNRRIRD